MNISFENVCYKVERGNFWSKQGEHIDFSLNISSDNIRFGAVLVSEKLDILKNINGDFRSRELSGIIGPSGSGKSTMLNILSGFTSKNVGGIIKVNENVANQKTIRRKSSYIMQENELHKYLTVKETITFAINLKVGKRLSVESRNAKVRNSVEINLPNCTDSRTLI